MNRQRLLLVPLLAVPLLAGLQCMGPSDNPDPEIPPPPLVVAPTVRITTSRGTIEIELFAVQAPLTVANFQKYLYDGYYGDTLVEIKAAEGIHLGRLRTDGTVKAATYPAVKSESANGLPHSRGYIAMVPDQSGDAGSATRVFAIYTTAPPAASGRTVFGRVIRGLGAVDDIVQAKDATTAVQRMRELDANGREILGTPATLPTLTPPANVSGVVATGVQTPVSLGSATAADYDGKTLTASNDAPAAGFYVGTTTVHWWTINSYGHVAAATQTVGVTAQSPDNPRVHMYTNMGEMVAELFPTVAPVTVDNFLRYVRDGFYKELIWHRIVKKGGQGGSGIGVDQTGGFTFDRTARQPVRDPIVNESDNRVANGRGTIAMARTENPDSATSQFYINVTDNDVLNYASADEPGYCVFGTLVSGLDVADRINAVPTNPNGTPVDDVFLYAIEVVGEESPTVTTETGLRYKDFVVGTGETPAADAFVAVNYVGSLDNWTEFDRNMDPADPAEFSLGGVIPGFSEGIRSMRVGGSRLLIIPPDLGYGDNPPPGSGIPPGATLIFFVKLIAIR